MKRKPQCTCGCGMGVAVEKRDETTARVWFGTDKAKRFIILNAKGLEQLIQEAQDALKEIQ